MLACGGLERRLSCAYLLRWRVVPEKFLISTDSTELGVTSARSRRRLRKSATGGDSPAIPQMKQFHWAAQPWRAIIWPIHLRRCVASRAPALGSRVVIGFLL